MWKQYKMHKVWNVKMRHTRRLRGEKVWNLLMFSAKIN